MIKRRQFFHIYESGDVLVKDAMHGFDGGIQIRDYYIKTSELPADVLASHHPECSFVMRTEWAEGGRITRPVTAAVC